MTDKSDRISRPLTQAALTFAAMGLLLGFITSARFFGFVFAAFCGLVPLVFGPRRYRVWGLFVLLAGGLMGFWYYEDFQSDPYFVKGRAHMAFETADDYRQAAHDYHEQYNAWPARLADMEISVDAALIRSVEFTPAGAMVVTLSFHPLEGAAFRLAPEMDGERIVWRCENISVPRIYLPATCRGE